MATAVVPVSVSGGNHVKTSGILSVKSGAFVKTQSLTFRSRTSPRTNRNLSIHAQSKYDDSRHYIEKLFNDRSSSSGADFVAGFLLGGAVFGTLGYIFSPQIRRSLLNENEHGFTKARGPVYYADYYDDEEEDDDDLDGFEKTKRTLHEKIGQLNSAIDKVATRLRGDKKFPPAPVETDVEDATV